MRTAHWQRRERQTLRPIDAPLRFAPEWAVDRESEGDYGRSPTLNLLHAGEAQALASIIAVDLGVTPAWNLEPTPRDDQAAAFYELWPTLSVEQALKRVAE